VYGNQRKKKNPYIYQSLQFLVGGQLPLGVVRDMSDRQRCEIWVLGICYVPADVKYEFWGFVMLPPIIHKNLAHGIKAIYMFHTDVNDVDADKLLFGKCPEVMRVENCLPRREFSENCTPGRTM
jgi:hypothetical protein